MGAKPLWRRPPFWAKRPIKVGKCWILCKWGAIFPGSGQSDCLVSSLTVWKCYFHTLQHAHSKRWKRIASLSWVCTVSFSVNQSERVISHVGLCAEHINRKSRGEAMTTHVLRWSLYWDLLWGSDEVIGLFHSEDDLIGQFCVWETRVLLWFFHDL